MATPRHFIHLLRLLSPVNAGSAKCKLIISLLVDVLSSDWSSVTAVTSAAIPVLPLRGCEHQMAQLSRSLQHVNCLRDSTWDTLICFPFRAEKDSHFFLIKEEPADTPTCSAVEAETQLRLCGVKSCRQTVPGRCLSDATREIDHRSAGPISRQQILR